MSTMQSTIVELFEELSGPEQIETLMTLKRIRSEQSARQHAQIYGEAFDEIVNEHTGNITTRIMQESMARRRSAA